ncbi:kinase-like domain-containing protein [Trichoderma austrokoningii]
MESSPSMYAVSHSRGRQKDESVFTRKMREKRAAMGRARSSDEYDSDDSLEQGALILHKLFRRKVVLQPDGTVIKSGKRIPAGEVEALRQAASAGLPAPCLHEVHVAADGETRIRMGYVEGQSLDKLWADLSSQEKKDITQQLGKIVDQMRAVTPPPRLIGACDGTEIRDLRAYSTCHSPPCHSEEEFNAFLLSSLHVNTPPLLREAFSGRLRTNHRIVFSHCDLAPRNIMVKDGKITGLVDWEHSGWYPEYWEYVKFFQQSGGDWRHYGEEIFADRYPDELVDYNAMSRWQNS